MPRDQNMAGTAAIGRSMFHSANITATTRGRQQLGAIKEKMSPRSATIVDRCKSRCITKGLKLALY
jgi:hypothetical protein